MVPALGPERQTVRKLTVSDKLSVDQMIGKMVVIGFWGSDPASPGVQAVCKWLKHGVIGGVIFFEDNLPSPRAAMDLTARHRAECFLKLRDQPGSALILDPLPQYPAQQAERLQRLAQFGGTLPARTASVSASRRVSLMRRARSASGYLTVSRISGTSPASTASRTASGLRLALSSPIRSSFA
jgi:hypothetical protein